MRNSSTSKEELLIFNNVDFTYTIVNLTDDYSVPYETGVKFNLAYTTADGYFGILCENNGADRKIMYKVNLDTLALTPLMQVGTRTQGNMTGRFIAPDTTYTDYAIVDTGGSNDDFTGCERTEINS